MVSKQGSFSFWNRSLLTQMWASEPPCHPSLGTPAYQVLNVGLRTGHGALCVASLGCGTNLTPCTCYLFYLST